MEFLSLSRRRSSVQNVPNGKERGETDVFAGYTNYYYQDIFPFSNSLIVHEEKTTFALLWNKPILETLFSPSYSFIFHEENNLPFEFV